MRHFFESHIDLCDKDVSIGDAELIERKGRGHPDSIADALASALSREYSNYTIRHCDGQILHHQFDKTMIIGGATRVDFGGGEFVEPIRVVLSGRISETYLGRVLPVRDLCEDVVRKYFATHFPMVPAEMIEVHYFLTTHAGPGTLTDSSGSIASMFGPTKRGEVRGYEELVANDTSYCVAYTPHSPLEEYVLELERGLTNSERRQGWEWLGSDIKVMAYRQGNRVQVTSCIPQIAAHVGSLDNYRENLNVIKEHFQEVASKLIPDYDVEVQLNTKDNDDTRNYYLTVSGASLSGDIGVVGRGNRVNGLITSQRPMSLEGINGKNPRYYSGFVYAVASRRASETVYERTGVANIVEIVGQNGAPLTQPWAVRVTGHKLDQRATDIIKETLEKIPTLTEEFLRGEAEHF